jgi:5-methylthioadenosine/S-adenosylhomocysteine deaminase
MRTRDGWSRRGFLGAAAALPVAGLGAAGARADEGAAEAAARPSGRLPARAHVVIRDAHVLSMDPDVGELARGDVHVRGGRIVAVGRNLRAGGAQEIDGRGTIVMPGLVDTHWHCWTALYRSMASSSPENAYFALNLRNGAQFRPGDIYQGVRLALTDAIHSGITTVHDWSHNLRGPAYADANLRAHAELGIRGRFSYGAPQGLPATSTIDLADLARVQREWFAAGKVPLTHLGLAGRPPGTAAPEVYRAEYAAARKLGLPVSYHVNSTPAQAAQDMIGILDREGFLGRQTQLIHATWASAADRATIARSGSSLAISPWSELLIGYGVTPVKDFVGAKLPLTLSVDTLPLTGTAELFSVMRLTLGLGRGQLGQEFGLAARDVLAMATIDAANALGIGGRTGSLTPGKRADVIMVRTDQVNVAPLTDAVNLVVLAAQAANVDTVLVDGRILKRHGRLTAVDPQRVVRQASAALARVLARAKAQPPAAAAAAAAAAHDHCCA